MKVCILIKIKAQTPLLLSKHLKVRLSIKLTTSQGAKYLKFDWHSFPARKGLTLLVKTSLLQHFLTCCMAKLL